jgi:2-oxoglutarate ferredoxin oxidoreductase subunit alpha
MFDLTFLAFDLADRYRNPAMILTDGRLGQMMEPLVPGDKRPTFPPKPWALTGAAGRPPNMIRSLILPEGELEEHNIKLQAKYALAESAEVRFEE